jgi:hypothetical protein
MSKIDMFVKAGKSDCVVVLKAGDKRKEIKQDDGVSYDTAFENGISEIKAKSSITLHHYDDLATETARKLAVLARTKGHSLAIHKIR